MREDSKFKLDDFKLYRMARGFKKRIYGVIGRLPDMERFVLSLRMRKAISSVTDNIARGHGCWYFQEDIYFCKMSIGSVEKIILDLESCFAEGYVGRKEAIHLKLEAYSLIRHINRYISYLIKTTGSDFSCARCTKRSSRNPEG